jgi:beta-lactamase class C
MRTVAGALIMAMMAGPMAAPRTDADGELKRLVTQEIQELLPANDAGGVAVAIRIAGHTSFFNYGFADLAGRRPVTSDSLFNLASLRKVFETTLLAQAVRRGELELDDRVAKFVTELAQGGDIRRVTLGQLATHTSGLLLPQDHPPWPKEHYTLPEFIRTLNAWHADEDQAPGGQHMYTHAGFVLLQLALERRFGKPIGELIEKRVVQPLGMSSTKLPLRRPDGRAALAPALMSRAVQGYYEDGTPIGEPGDQQGYYDFPGTGQMYSSARDLAIFLAANLGELPGERSLTAAMRFAQRGVFAISLHNTQALAWEINDNAETSILEKNGGLDNSSTYIGMMPSRKLGIVILANRGDQAPAEVGRRILLSLAKRNT